MKAITLRQPYAWLVVNGHKDIENRSWSTSHRGPLLIHAAMKWPYTEQMEAIEEKYRIEIAWDEIVVGGIVGRVELVDCVTAHRSPWFIPRVGNVGWVLAKAKRLPFRAMPGKLRLWDVEL